MTVLLILAGCWLAAVYGETILPTLVYLLLFFPLLVLIPLYTINAIVSLSDNAACLIGLVLLVLSIFAFSRFSTLSKGK